jgi:hypothetical protein
MKALMHTQRIARLLVLVWRAFVERLLRALAVVFSRCLHGFVIIPLQSATYHTNMVSTPVVCSINTLRTVRGDWLSTLSWGITNLALSIKTILGGHKYCFLCKCHLIVNKVQLFFQVLGRSGWKTLFIGLKSFVVVRFCHNVYKILCGSQIKAVSSANESRRDSLFIFENSQAELLMVKQKTITNSASAVSTYLYFVLLSALLLGGAIVMVVGLIIAEMTMPYYTASLCYSVPLIVFMGIASSLLICTIYPISVKSDRIAGSIYAISATGIVIGILIAGLLFVPQAAGVEHFTLLAGLILAGVALRNTLYKNKWRHISKR